MRRRNTLAILLLVSALLMCVNAFALPSNEPAITVTADKSNAKPGETVNLEVKISGDYKDIRGIGVRVLLPSTVFSNITYSGLDKLNIPGNSSKDGTCTSDANADSNKGFLAYIAYWDNAYTGNLDLTIMTITATVRNDAATGNADIKISDNLEHTSYTNSKYETLAFKLVNPVFSITDGASVAPKPNTPEGTEKPATITKQERMKNTIILQVGNYASAVDGALCHIYPGEKNIVPYLKVMQGDSGRAMVPIRFIAEKLGAKVGWEDKTSTLTISLNGNEIRMSVGSTEYTVNGVKKTMDAAAEVKFCDDSSGNGRTMVPIRFVAEALGKAVQWDSENKLIIITDASTPWNFERDAEKEVTNDVLLIMSP